jgi:hypothetical protein
MNADDLNENLKSAMRALVLKEAGEMEASRRASGFAPDEARVDVGFAYLCLLKWQTHLMRASKAIDLAEHVISKAAA